MTGIHDRRLARRVSLGVVLCAEEPFTPRGLRAGGVVTGSMAEAAGIAAGDVIVALAGLPLRTEEELREATRRAGERAALGALVAVAAERDGVRFERDVAAVLRASEHVDGHGVSYEQVVADDGVRLRTIVTRPEAAGRHPAVLFVQGIDRESIDFGAETDAPVRALVHGWAREGFVTMRVEKRGVGDSDGDEAGFDVEMGDHRAALRALAADPAVDPDAVFLFGHSVGGMIAPLLGDEGIVRGVMVMGTSARRWTECVAASTGRQLALRGWGAEEIAAAVAEERAAGFGVRAAAYHAELEARDLGAAWERVACDVLVIVGEHDWVVGEDEQEEIFERVSARRKDAAELWRVSGLDHGMTRHASREESVLAPGRGAFDERLVTGTAAWMRGRRVVR